MRVIPIVIPEETDILAAGAEAAALGLHLICNGRETRISRLVPPGWFKVAVKVRPVESHGESLPCAA